MRFRQTGLIVAATALFVFAAAAQATPVFLAHVRNDDNGSGPNVSAAVPVDTLDVTLSSNLGVPQFIGRGAASGGQVRARGNNESISVPQNFNGLNASTRTQMELNDVLITGPAGVQSVQTSLNFRVDGAMGTVGAIPDAAVALSAVTVSVSATGLPYLEGQKIFLGNNLDSESGIFSGMPGSDIHSDFTTPLFTFATLSSPNPNNIVQLGLIISTGAANGTSAFSNFFDGGGVHFPTSGPVFNLPEGFTANSVSGLIVDNHWIGVVPEPSTFLLGSIAAVGLSVLAIRRKSRRSEDFSQPCS